MASVFDKLGLRPQEQRFVVLTVTIIVIVVSVLFIFPRFKDWGRLQGAKAAARATLQTNQKEIARVPEYRSQLQRLELAGSAVLKAEQALDLTRTVQNKAQEMSVAITGIRPAAQAGAGSTNQFFDEQLVSVDVSCLDQELVNFLVALGSGDSMIRVRDMDLRPDPPHYRLVGKITLVASYQKTAKAAPPAATPRSGATRRAPGPAAPPPSTPKGST